MRSDRTLDRIAARLRRRLPLTRYDLVLLFVPVTFLSTVGVAGMLGLSQRVALVAWSVAGLVALVDALFLNPPTTGGRAD